MEKQKVLVLKEIDFRKITVGLAHWAAYARRSNAPDVGMDYMELCQEIRRQLANQKAAISVAQMLDKEVTEVFTDCPFPLVMSERQ